MEYCTTATELLFFVCSRGGGAVEKMPYFHWPVREMIMSVARVSQNGMEKTTNVSIVSGIIS